MLVDKKSATHNRPWEMDTRFIIPINRTHADLVKFEPYSHDYEMVLECLRELLKTSEDVVSRHLK